jgi:hypothetical protein
VLLSAGGVLLLLGVSVVVAAAAAGGRLAPGTAAQGIPTVRCDRIVDTVDSGESGGYRVVLGIVSAPPIYLPQVVRDPTSAPFTYWRKAGMVTLASPAALVVSVPRAWRERVRITWGNEPL